MSYAKDQPAGFTNAIERVAIVGVCKPLPPSQSTIQDETNKLIRPEVLLALFSLLLSLKLENTPSLPSRAKTAPTNSLRASLSPPSTTAMRTPLSMPSRANSSLLLLSPPLRPATRTASSSRRPPRQGSPTSYLTDTPATLSMSSSARMSCSDPWPRLTETRSRSSV